MSPAFQKVLLTLYLDEGFISAFAKNKAAAIANLPLTEREREAILALPTSEVEHFSQELIHKRHRVARNIWAGYPREKQPIFYFPFHRSGAHLFVRTAEGDTEIPLSEGMSEFFFELAEAKAPLVLKWAIEAIRRALLRSVKERKETAFRFVDLFLLARLIRTHKLAGKMVRRTL